MEINEKEQAVVDQIKDKVTEPLQKQINKLYERTDQMSHTSDTKGHDSRELKESNEWLRMFLKGHKDLNTKDFTDYMATDPDASGGYLVPELLSDTIAHYTLQTGVARMRMRYMPFNGAGNSRRIPKEVQGVSVNWIDEAEAKPITKISIDEVVHQLKKLASIAVITEELAEDTSINLTDYVGRRIGEAIAREEDRVYLAGEAATGDPFDGILNVTGVKQKQMEVGQGIGDVDADDLLNLIYTVDREARTGAAFYCNSDVLFKLQLLKDSNGAYLVSRPIAESEPTRIFGYPIYTADVMPAEDDSEAELPFMFFANLQKAAVYGDKRGVRTKLLTESSLTDSDGNTINLAQNDMIGVRVHKRTGYACVHPEGISVLVTGTAT